jgi:hypothetical protein
MNLILYPKRSKLRRALILFRVCLRFSLFSRNSDAVSRISATFSRDFSGLTTLEADWLYFQQKGYA